MPLSHRLVGHPGDFSFLSRTQRGFHGAQTRRGIEIGLGAATVADVLQKSPTWRRNPRVAHCSMSGCAKRVHVVRAMQARCGVLPITESIIEIDPSRCNSEVVPTSACENAERGTPLCPAFRWISARPCSQRVLSRQHGNVICSTGDSESLRRCTADSPCKGLPEAGLWMPMQSMNVGTDS